MSKMQRNAPCVCGSGKKYKKCCMLKLVEPVASVGDLIEKRINRIERELDVELDAHAQAYYGERAFVEAAEEYFCWAGIPDDGHMKMETGHIIVRWFYFNWQPDNEENNAERAPLEYFPEETIAQHFLKIKGDKVSSDTRQFIEQACTNHYSFFVVEEFLPDEKMMLTDILLQKRVTVSDENNSEFLSLGDILYSRVITFDQTSVMLGCAPVSIPAGYYADIIDMRERMLTSERELDQESLQLWDEEIRQLYLWIREYVLFPPKPAIQNGDGDPLQPMTLHYDLLCTPQDALDALKTLTKFKTDEQLLFDAKYKKGRLCKITIPWLEKAKNKTVAMGETLMAELVIDGSTLSVTVNSENRAAQIKRKITRRLGKRAFFKLSDYESIEYMMEQQSQKTAEILDMPTLEDLPPEMQAEMTKMAKKHWQDWLTMPVPALKNKTPCQAAKTKAGRELLSVLLLDFESRDDSANLFAPDVNELRRALGLKNNKGGQG